MLHTTEFCESITSNINLKLIYMEGENGGEVFKT